MNDNGQAEILVVVDDEIFCRCLAEVLHGQANQVTWTVDGLVAYELARQKSYDLYIIDARMPQISGMELAQRLRLIDGAAAMILVSGFADDWLKQFCDAARISLLSKPFDIVRLIETVRRLLAAAHAKSRAEFI